MEQNYKIIIFTTEGVIERVFYKKETAIEAIAEFKRRFNDFMTGVVSEKIKGKWNNICRIEK